MAKKKQQKTRKKTRPPVLTVLGHVDHGKTTLLDAIRKTQVAQAEAGGITQHIGAYQIDYQGQKLTFIDTPGHEAFAKMRLHGAEIADIAILVVAADDGVQPQTKEAIKHIRAAQIPFLVAINKIDLPQASVDKVKNELNQEGVFLEGYGGDIVNVAVSAKRKKNLDELLEMIVLLAEMQELKADSQGHLEGLAVEAYLDSKKGVVTSVVVKNGTLSVRDKLWLVNKKGDLVGKGKVKAMSDDLGNQVKQAIPGDPVEILGINKVVPLGSLVFKQGDENYVEERIDEISGRKEKEDTTEEDKQEVAADEKEEAEKEETEKAEAVKVILKADTYGTLEAVKDSLPVGVELVSTGVGKVSESDILLASSSDSLVVAFNLPITKNLKKLADMESVIIKNYQIIYELIKELKDMLKGETEGEGINIVGQAEIIAEFDIRGDHIAGCLIRKGKMNRSNKVRVIRDNKVIGEADIDSFQQEGTRINEASSGTEVGLVLKPDLDFQVGDDIISYNKKLN
jgi:translation initiation factor IF-2